MVDLSEVTRLGTLFLLRSSPEPLLHILFSYKSSEIRKKEEKPLVHFNSFIIYSLLYFFLYLNRVGIIKKKL